ncbi:two-component regulator propeller domain-containing protein [Nibrella viscosa]|uniref:histidine kinase n=1 Tax=Nibrella viscosa TaxID=1084524 RepID=A0ABP8KFW6_9BACT
MLLVGQPKGWQELTISNGLSQGMIFDLKQDAKGFIWIATKDGLNRYDGHNFVAFTHDPYNDFSISGNNCTALLIDSRKRLWVGTLNQGLNLFDDQTQRFYHIDITDQSAPNAGNYEIWLLAEDPDGNIWVGTAREKLFRISLPDVLKNGFPAQPNFTRQARLTCTTLHGTASNVTAHRLVFGADGNATIGTTRGIFTFNWHRVNAGKPAGWLAGELAGVGLTDNDAGAGYWFASTVTHIHGWYQGRHKAIRVPGQSSWSIPVKFVDSTTVAIATLDYLWLMSPAELMAQDSLTARNAFTVMPPNLYNLTRLLKDQSGMIWVGTGGYGLRIFNPRVKQFGAYLSNTSLAYLYMDRQGRIYAHQLNQYKLLDRSANSLKTFTNDPAGLQHRFLMQDHRGNFWIGYEDLLTHEHYLLMHSADWKPQKKYPMPAGTAFGIFGNQIKEDRNGTLWIGATNGKLVAFHPVTETFRVFSYQHLLPQSGADIETFALYFDKSGTGWIGTPKGLIRATNPTDAPIFSVYKNTKADRQSLSNDVVSCVLDDPYEPLRYLWVSTKGGGLDRLDKQTGQFTHFTEDQGLPNKVVYGILADEFNTLWLSTNRGLAQFNPKTLRFRNYTKADGLQDDEFNTGSFFRAPTGELLFGGVNGLNIFRAGAVNRQRSHLPQVHLIGLSINNEPVTVGSPGGILTRSIENTQQIDLAHTQNLVTVEFGVMDYTNPAGNRYRYRLAGIDRTWVEAGNNRFANYAQLPDGRYTLQVMGSADGEIWSKPVELQIRIHPPVYRSWWAYLLYTLALLLVGWQVYRFQTQRLLLEQQVAFEQKEAGRLAELDALKTRFFTNISHEFRTPLTLILGPVEEAIQEYVHDTRFPLIQRNAVRLQSLINQLLDLSKLEAGQLKAELEPGDLAAFFRTLAGSFSSLAESRQIMFTFVQSETERWVNFDRDKLEKITSNLLSNAFKFTPEGKDVRMTVTYPEPGSADSLQLRVGDTGIGIPADHLPRIFERFYQVDGTINRSYEGTGIGLALVNELVKVLGGTITVSSTAGTGTTFTVNLPLTAAVAQPRQPSLLTQTAIPEPDRIRPNVPEAPDERLPVPPDKVLLIIDDNADIRTYIRGIFQLEYQILEATDGVDGLEKATAMLPDLVICDLMMPRLNGFGFCRTLKSQEVTSHIPVVMLTAKAAVENRIEGFQLGADDYLTKPFNRAELQARVQNLLEQRKRLYAWFTTRLPASPTPVVAPPALTAEQTFIDRLTAVVIEHMSRPGFSVETLADNANLSRSQLHRKLKALLDMSPTNFIRNIRLAKAAELLSEGNQSITLVAYAVGFDNLSYFAKVFQEQYGMLPSQYGSRNTQPSA